MARLIRWRRPRRGPREALQYRLQPRLRAGPPPRPGGPAQSGPRPGSPWCGRGTGPPGRTPARTESPSPRPRGPPRPWSGHSIERERAPARQIGRPASSGSAARRARTSEHPRAPRGRRKPSAGASIPYGPGSGSRRRRARAGRRPRGVTSANRVHGGRGPEEGVEDARQQRLDVVVHQRGGCDAIERAQRARALPCTAPPMWRWPDRSGPCSRAAPPTGARAYACAMPAR